MQASTSRRAQITGKFSPSLLPAMETETGSLDGRISGRRRALARVQQLTVIIIAFYFIAIHLFIYQSGKCSFEPYNNRLCSCKRTAFIPILENTLLYSRFPEFFLPSKGMSLLRIVLVDRFVAWVPAFKRSIFRPRRRKLHEMLPHLSPFCDGISRWQMELIYLIVAKRRVFERGGESNVETLLERVEFYKRCNSESAKVLKEK